MYTLETNNLKTFEVYRKVIEGFFIKQVKAIKIGTVQSTNLETAKIEAKKLYGRFDYIELAW